MGLLKAFGAAATAAGEGLAQMGALKFKEEKLEEQRNWEWKKMEWLADKESKAAATASSIDAYKTIIDQVGKEIESIDKALAGAPNVMYSGYDKDYLDARRKALGVLATRADTLLMQKSGIDQNEIEAFLRGVEKISDGGPDNDNKLTKDEEEAIAKQEIEGGGDGFFSSVLGYMPQGFLEGTPRKVALIGEAIRNIAWENDILLNAVKKYGKEVGKVFIPNEDSEIRKTIASVLEGDESIANAKSAEDIKNIIKDKGLLNSIVGKIMSAFESGAKEEWKGTEFEGMSPGEVEEAMFQKNNQAGIIDNTDGGLLSQAEKDAIDSDMERVYAGGTGRDVASAGELQPGAVDVADSVSMHPDREVVDTPRGETLETPPAPIEPYDANYVEGREVGTTPITSMTVGEIANEYGYNTKVGMMALTYNEIIDIIHKYIYNNMLSKKEVRERVDSLPFGDNLQRKLMYLSLEED